MQANGGTLFLDEVAEIPLPTQVKLLRALEHNEVVPVGSSHAVPIDFRVISATRQHLIERADEAHFRHDLLFRLGAFQIELPPLRDRPEDVADLASYFIERLASGANEQAARADRPDARRTGTPAVARQRPRVAQRDRARADHGPRPGDSARAFAAERAGSRCRSRRRTESTKRWRRPCGAGPSDRSAMRRSPAASTTSCSKSIEPPLLETALRRHRGQCAAAARTLGIHRTTLRKKLTQHGLGDDSQDES